MAKTPSDDGASGRPALAASFTLPALRGWRAREKAQHEPLWLEWVALGALLVFAAWLLGVRGVWALLLHADPTGITLVIIIVFACATLWCGGRASRARSNSIR